MPWVWGQWLLVPHKRSSGISNDPFWVPKERRKLPTVSIHIQDFSLFSDEGIGSVLRLVNGPLTAALEIFF